MPVSKRQYRKLKLKGGYKRKTKLSKKKQYRKLKLKGGSKRKLKLKGGSKRKLKLLKGGSGVRVIMHSLTNAQEDLANKLSSLKSIWYLTGKRKDAESELTNKPKGTFLIRPSSKERSAVEVQAVEGSTRPKPYWSMTVKQYSRKDAFILANPDTSLFWNGLIEENDNKSSYFINLGPSEADTEKDEILQFPKMEDLVATLMTDETIARKIGLLVDLKLDYDLIGEFGTESEKPLDNSEYSDDDLIDKDFNILSKIENLREIHKYIQWNILPRFIITTDCVNKYFNKSETENGTFIIYRSMRAKRELPTADLEASFDSNYDFTYYGTLVVRENGENKHVYIIKAEENGVTSKPPPLRPEAGGQEQTPDTGGYGLFYPFDSETIYGDDEDVQAKSTDLYSSVAELLAKQSIINANNYYRKNRTSKGYLVCKP